MQCCCLDCGSTLAEFVGPGAGEHGLTCVRCEPPDYFGDDGQARPDQEHDAHDDRGDELRPLTSHTCPRCGGSSRDAEHIARTFACDECGAVWQKMLPQLNYARRSLTGNDNPAR